MDKDKKIEEMAKVLYGHYCGRDKCGECKQPNCLEYRRAELLQNAGYGNVKQAVKEFAEQVKQIICDCTVPTFDKDHKPISKFVVEGYKKIDDLINKIYGEE